MGLLRSEPRSSKPLVNHLRSSNDLADGDPSQAEVAEITYQQGDSPDQDAYFESVGLTVLEHRMMITIHLFYTDESAYSLDIGEEEAGFAHPQLGLVQAAAKSLSD